MLLRSSSAALFVEYCCRRVNLRLSYLPSALTFAVRLSKMAIDDEVEKGDFFFYFAYGSNLLKERLHVQIKNAVFESVGLLRHHKLCFFDHSARWSGALASIEECAEGEVWGCVWRVPNSFAEELDIQEHSYHRLQVNVETSGGEVSCRTYQYSNKSRKSASPSPHYKHVIVSGAAEHSIPIHYIEKLKAVNDNGYAGSVAVKLKALEDLERRYS